MKPRVLLTVLLGLLVAAVVASLSLGKYPVGPREIGGLLSHVVLGRSALDGEALQTVSVLLLEVRAPRIAAAMLVGAALSVSGATFQSMFINPLVSPGLLGVLAGASFGAALGMLIFSNWVWVQVMAFAFGLIAVLLALCMARFYRGDRLLLLVLGGIISGAFFTALLSIIKYLADPSNQLPAIVYWLMGGFGTVNARTTLALGPLLSAGILMLLFAGAQLNVLSMGDEEAKSMGLRVSCLRTALILAATCISSLTVILGGIIGWVGLVIPHIGRMLVGPDNRILLPLSAVIGALYLLVVDNVSRLLGGVEIPIGILTAIMGIPAFAIILRHAKKGWS